MAKHIETLGSFEDFKAPWETEDGSEAEVDKPRLKRLIYNVKADLAKARDAHDDTKATLASVEKERDEAKDEAADANGAEAQKKIDRLEAKVADLTKERDGLISAKEIADLRAEVLEGVDPKHAKHVVGETREELEKSLAEIREDFGLPAPGDEDGDDDEDDEPQVRTRPRTLRNSGDPEIGKSGPEVIDFDAVADGIVSGGSPFR